MRFEWPERHSRLTTFFRVILAIPAYIIPYLLDIALRPSASSSGW